ncbi:ABC transporter substrate-binding protein [Oceanobacillus sp. FSL K6-2867]|uniref:ABC transporter substrate-binding protein n=1 Tax=Oceanobacillus sp. FSL K6-2867 TaxID=2954748 RepID=UPI0030DA4B8F
MRRKSILIVLAGLLIVILVACSGQSGEQIPEESVVSSNIDNNDDASSDGNHADVIKFTDLAGRESALDATPEKIIVAEYISNYLMVGGSESLDKVVGMTLDGWEGTRYGEYTVYTDAFPQMLDGEDGITSIGGYHDNLLNMELIISLQPDVIIMSPSQYTENNNSISTLENAGIVVAVLDYHSMQVENHVQSNEILGMLLGREEVAQKQIDTYVRAIDDINARIADLPDSQKQTRVYVELGNKGTMEYGNSYNNIMLWGAAINNLQADNLASNLDAIGPLDKEFILSSNPEIIFIGGSVWSGDTKGDQMRMGFTVDEDLAQERLIAYAQRPEWEPLDAVINGEVYGVDHGSLRNIADYTFTQYLAKVIYPDVFTDLDPVQELNDFYERYLPELKYTATFMVELP